jgi:hypothetical protein
MGNSFILIKFHIFHLEWKTKKEGRKEKRKIGKKERERKEKRKKGREGKEREEEQKEDVLNCVENSSH